MSAVERGYASFETVCRRVRISPFSMEEMLMDEMGMTGEEVMDIYRTDISW